MNKAHDKVFKALADPTRRRILDELRGGSKNTSQLVALFPGLSRFAVLKHLDVLKQCDLVLSRKAGRQVINTLNAVPLRQVYVRWVSKYEDLWASTLMNTKQLAEDEHEPND